MENLLKKSVEEKTDDNKKLKKLKEYVIILQNKNSKITQKINLKK